MWLRSDMSWAVKRRCGSPCEPDERHDAAMLFMIVEHFEGGDPAPVYRRFAERGRMAPTGLEYHGSWVTDDLTRCYQVMECADRSLLEEWMGAWDDLVRFEVIEVMSSADAVAAVAARLGSSRSV